MFFLVFFFHSFFYSVIYNWKHIFRIDIQYCHILCCFYRLLVFNLFAVITWYLIPSFNICYYGAWFDLLCSSFNSYIGKLDSITISVWNHKKIHKKQGAGFLGCVRLLSNVINRLKDTGCKASASSFNLAERFLNATVKSNFGA